MLYLYRSFSFSVLGPLRGRSLYVGGCLRHHALLSPISGPTHLMPGTPQTFSLQEKPQVSSGAAWPLIENLLSIGIIMFSLVECLLFAQQFTPTHCSESVTGGNHDSLYR